MTAVRSVGIVGTGFAGCAAAILLAEGGVQVELFDANPGVGALGSGITMQGNAIRTLDHLGVWDRVREHSFAFESLGLRAPDAVGTVIAVIPDAKMGGPDYPATIGAYRPEVARILVDRAEEAGATFTWNARVDALSDRGDGVELAWRDAAGTAQHRRFDLVIGADGLHSTVRRLVGIEVEPRRIGMGIWRAFVPRPAEVDRTDLTYGGPCYIAGYCPTSDDRVYAYLVEDAQDRAALSPEQQVATMKRLAEAYHGPWDEIRESIGPDSRVNYTWFTTHLVDGPWNRGRVVLIGDAAHSCPPTIAQGAAMGLEDGAVLAELLLAAGGVDDDLWRAFADRRFARAKDVVDASVRLAEWQLTHDPDADVPGLMRRVAELVSVPA